jgi:hypothetical protein
MPNYVQIIDGKIEQVAVGFESPPFPNAVEAPDYVAENPAKWEYIDGEFVEKTLPVPPEPEQQPQPPSLEDRLKAVEDALLSML